MVQNQMQPIWLMGHTRPVRQVLHNYDGDLLFTCSDDSKVCMYDTYQCTRSGTFNTGSACNSIDLTKDSKYLLAAAAVTGVCIFNVATGEKVAEIEVPGNLAVTTKLAFGDKLFFCMYKHEKYSVIRVYELAEALKCGTTDTPKHVKEIRSFSDNVYTHAIWGALNKTIYACTNAGKLLSIDYASGKTLKEMNIHKSEIYQI